MFTFPPKSDGFEDLVWAKFCVCLFSRKPHSVDCGQSCPALPVRDRGDSDRFPVISLSVLAWPPWDPVSQQAVSGSFLQASAAPSFTRMSPQLISSADTRQIYHSPMTPVSRRPVSESASPPVGLSRLELARAAAAGGHPWRWAEAGHQEPPGPQPPARGALGESGGQMGSQVPWPAGSRQGTPE